MKRKIELSKTMTIVEFDNGYWYATELAEFADSIGVPSAKKLRKDELEKAIKAFLRTGKVAIPTKRNLRAAGVRDVDMGLSLDLPVVRYTNDAATKDFIVREAQRIAPRLKERSGVRYRLNRWREEQLTKGIAITYADLVAEYVRLNRSEEPFARIPHGRYINFLAEFLAGEKDATRSDAIEAWEKLKELDIPKNYRAWKRSRT
jgi:SAP domain-containing protein